MIKKTKYRMEIGAQLSKIRLEKGFSMLELADKVGTGKNNIYRIEHGVYSASVDLVGAVAEALGAKIKIENLEKLQKEEGVKKSPPL